MSREKSATRAGMAERLRTARRATGMSQEALAQRLGIRRAAVTQWEHLEGTLPSVVNLLQAAVETGVTFEWLATGRGTMRLESDEVPAFSTDCIAQGADEEHLLAAFRRLNNRQREALMTLLSGLGGRTRLR